MARQRTPKLCYHKGSKQGYVTLDGLEVYLGRWPGGPKAAPPVAVREEYDRRVAAWLARRKEVPEPVGTDPTVDEIWLSYFSWCSTYYVKRGKPTTEAGTIKQACRIAARLFGNLPARSFGLAQLRAVRDEMVGKGWARGHVNKQVSRVRGMFRWAAENELLPAAVWHTLLALKPLKKGRTTAPEEEKVRPVNWAAVEATLPELASPVREMVRVHRLLGCRAEDVCAMRSGDIDRAADPEGALWKWTPADVQGPTWKTEHHEKEEPLHYWVGAEAQAVLVPLLPDDPAAPVFPTAGKKGNGRRTGFYDTAGYRRAVRRAIDRANAKRAAADPPLPPVARWSPLQIRHTRLTEIRARYGAEASQSVSKHKNLSTTEIYAERNEELARKVMREMG
jgi:integrase